MPDPRHMDPNQAFAAWPSGTFHLSQRLRPDPAAATTDLATLLRFTAPLYLASWTKPKSLSCWLSCIAAARRQRRSCWRC